jgi:hypothetical protein
VMLRSIVVLTLVPAVLYVGSYSVWFAQAERTRTGIEHCGGATPCRLGALDRVDVWFHHQRDLLEFHSGLEPDNPYAAPAWTWLVQSEPAELFDKPCLPGTASPPPALDDHVCGDASGETRARMLVVANPVSWAAGLLSLAALGVTAVWPQRRKAAERSGAARSTLSIGEAGEAEAEQGGVAARSTLSIGEAGGAEAEQGDTDVAGVLIALAVAQWLPWVATGREVYSYYAVTLVPILALATVAVLDRYAGLRKWGLPVLLVASLAAFAWLYPLLTAQPLSDGAAGARLLLPGWSS